MSATIFIADKTGHYDGRDLERRPIGGTESSVIRLARALVRRGHDVACYTNCDGPVEDCGVRWLPLSSGLPERCDLYLPVHQTELLGLVRRPRRLGLWVIWPARQLRHYKRTFSQWRHRPVPIFASLHEAASYAWWLPPLRPKLVVPLGLPDDIRGMPPLDKPPPPQAVFASNPQRNLRRLVEIWLDRIVPRVPGAVLDVYSMARLPQDANVWEAWSGSLLPAGVSEEKRRSVRIRIGTERDALMSAVRNSRAMLYLGHRAEAFCLTLAEAQAMGVPAVVAPTAVLPERVIDGVTGYVRGHEAGFADAAVALLSDDALWRSQHEASLRLRQGLSWEEVAARIEQALLSDMLPTDWSASDRSIAERRQPNFGADNSLA